MSKSIYEETLEIIDRNIFELSTGFAVLYEIRKKIEQALKQAQKQEKLLELYKELITVKDDMFDACEIVYDDFFVFRETETKLERQIKELENDKEI